MDGIPALTVWDLVIEIFHSVPNQANKARYLVEFQGNLLQRRTLNKRNQIPTKHVNLGHSTANLSQQMVSEVGTEKSQLTQVLENQW